MKHAIVAHHPLSETPYNKLLFFGPSAHGTPLYTVLGIAGGPASARIALKRAFEAYGGRCFYCTNRLNPRVPDDLSLDHVVPLARGGTSLLHNVVLACKPCNRAKAADPIAEFMPLAGRAYFDALERHIADAVRSATSPD